MRRSAGEGPGAGRGQVRIRPPGARQHQHPRRDLRLGPDPLHAHPPRAGGGARCGGLRAHIRRHWRVLLLGRAGRRQHGDGARLRSGLLHPRPGDSRRRHIALGRQGPAPGDQPAGRSARPELRPGTSAPGEKGLAGAARGADPGGGAQGVRSRTVRETRSRGHRGYRGTSRPPFTSTPRSPTRVVSGMRPGPAPTRLPSPRRPTGSTRPRTP